MAEFLSGTSFAVDIPHPTVTVKTPQKQPAKPQKYVKETYPESYTNTSVESFTFLGSKYDVKYWKDVLIGISNIMLERHRGQFHQVLTLVGQKRPYFTKNPNELRVAERIDETDIFVEINVSANYIVELSRQVVTLFGYPKEALSFDFKSLQLKFWEQLLQRANEKGFTLHQGRSATQDSWLSTGAGKSGVTYEYLIRNHSSSIKLEISTGDRLQNKHIFDILSAHRNQIEQDFGEALTWDRADDKIASRVVYEVKPDGGLSNPEEEWLLTQDAMIDAMDRFFRAFNRHVQALE